MHVDLTAKDLILVTAPLIEPLTLEEVKDHLRIDGTIEDSYIEPLIQPAREWAEAYLNRALITQTWDLFLERFPKWSGTQIEIPFPKLQSITDVKYQDILDVQQIWSDTLYTVDTNREIGRIIPITDEDYPSTFGHIHDVVIRFVAGYGSNAEDVPRAILQGMLLKIGHWYERREDTSVAPMHKIPDGAMNLLTPYKVWRAV
ncbi:hypothetical protein LCGC14_1793180 [marine sediment metagenome]|uniref:Phage gp6-like head-tail connector protein n=1 Tax=marine sediment metagenome TaxID=412755 RepID=A0A0F9HEJ5_9ZZZZ